MLIVLLVCGLGVLLSLLVHWPDLLVERTSSMTPLIKPGALVIGQRIQPGQSPAVGQIVSYMYGDLLITHRIIGKNPDGTYIFKGDANPLADPFPVNHSQLREIVIGAIPQAGAVLEALTRPRGIALVALLIVVAGALLAGLVQRQATSRQQPRTILTLPQPEEQRERRAA